MTRGLLCGRSYPRRMNGRKKPGVPCYHPGTNSEVTEWTFNWPAKLHW